jgi:hypothetical protein
MSMEFGWWARDADGRKFQVRATVFGGRVTWARKHGHHQAWEPYGSPTDGDWTRLLAEAEKRLPRRLLSPKQLAAIKRRRPN